jgi:dienelactone hydrolase
MTGAALPGPAVQSGEGFSMDTQDVVITPVGLPGLLTLPPGARAVVVFAHGSGSSRFSPRNNQVAAGLQEAGLGTLLFDLLTAEEGSDRAKVFDIVLLAERLMLASRWLRDHHDARTLRQGCFGASTGAAAALVAAAEAGPQIGAVVSRGGRPDLAEAALPRVSAPTLLIVGERDPAVLDLNRAALARLGGPPEAHDLRIIPNATHLFEEPGALEAVIDEARRWFSAHLLEQTGPKG